MKRLVVLFWALMPLLVSAQELAGRWSGRLAVGDQKLRMILHLTRQGEGWRATMDSPDQGARGIPFDSVAVQGSALSLWAQALQVRLDLVAWGADHLMGNFSQGGWSTSLLLAREEEQLKRPQEPRPPFPYRSVEVSFAGHDGAVQLHGTLTLPEGAGRYPAVVLVTGSGTQNRDEELFDHKPFLLLADRLTRAGYAVLRYDDRGYGASPEEVERLRHTTTFDLMQDALGAVDWLAAHPEIDASHIGILGHSEGGTIAFLAAAESPKVAFVVSLAGMMVSGAALLVTQNQAVMRLQGVPEQMVTDYGEALRRLYGAWQRLSPAEVVATKEQLAAEAVAGLSLPEPMRKNLCALAEMANNSWLYGFVCLDPAEAIRKLGSRPCWAINGSKDAQVDAEQNLARLRALTADAPTVQTKCYEGLNHLFQPCTTGAVAEYGEIETTLAEEVLSDLVQWLDGHIR